jgi:hypothetical protein
VRLLDCTPKPAVTRRADYDESDLMTKPTKPTKPSTGRSKKPLENSNKTSAGPVSAKKVQSRKIVNQRQTPWGLIVTTVLVVVLAVTVIGYAVSKTGRSSSSEIKIAGIQHYTGLTRDHQTGTVSYAQSPPVGGNHAPVWADCTGTVYPQQIANENAVHTLEHGAVWITYKPGLASDQVDILSKLVAGNQYTLLTPYAGLKSNISLQAWGYQLFVDSASDSRIATFIKDLKLNQSNTPEFGASCDNADFKKNPSTPGHPTES